MMRFTRQLLAAGLAALLVSTANADSTITVRMSYKVVLNPDTGLPPPGVSLANIDQAIAAANELLKPYWRGYRLVRDGPLTNIGGAGEFDRPNPSHYYDIDFDQSPADFTNFDNDAHVRPDLYDWNFDAVNVFITHGFAGGHCSNPGTGRESIFIGSDSEELGWAILHETSHFMAECHTQGCNCGVCPGGGGECDTIPGDDFIADTLPDLKCWSRDDIANNWPPFDGRDYDELNPAEQELVNDVFYNLMAYHTVDHPPNLQHTRQTEMQLDLFADLATFFRTAVRNGRTFFVQANASGGEDGSSAFPFNRVAEGLSAGDSGRDIVLIRPGNYPENLRIHTPVTLRVPRTGHARIGENP